jgi:hypothetical protein
MLIFEANDYREINEIRDPSPCEKAFFLNIDWMRF